MQVINNGSGAAAPALSGAAQAAAAGTWPALPTWLFGFACGGAAATAMTYNYLSPQHTVVPTVSTSAAAAAVLGQHTVAGLQRSNSFDVHPSSSSSSGTNSAADQAFTPVSFPSGSGCSSSSNGSSSSSGLSSYLGPGGVWGFLQQLGRLGAGPAHGECA